MHVMLQYVLTDAVNHFFQGLHHIQQYYQEIDAVQDSAKIISILVATKCDTYSTKKRVVSKEQAQLFVDQRRIAFYVETSAQTGENVDILFHTIAYLCLPK